MTNPNENIERAILRLNGRAWGVSFGLLAGTALAVATLVLVIRGGQNVGQHLGLLSAYFPGYRVTVIGAFVGFVYAFVVGYALGRLVSSLYNRFAAY
jgi:ABC-type uncharacterized transport system fused permease/ATPase subunit